MNGTMKIGFSQRIRLEWLERTAALRLAGASREEIQEHLHSFLHDQISAGSDPKRGNRHKAITILLKVWVSPPAHLRPLCDEGLALLARLPAGEHLALHWGMSMAAYPFFGAVAEAVGRLLCLQGTVSAPQAQRRIREQLGERQTVARAARRILRCYVDWGVLHDTAAKGVYQAHAPRPVAERELRAWLAEALLRSGGATALPVAMLAQAPSLFPFTIERPVASELQSNPRLELFRQGLDEDMLALRHLPRP